jgi:hypothetical protein
VPKAYLWTRFAVAASGLRAIAMPAIISANTPAESKWNLTCLRCRNPELSLIRIKILEEN